MSCCSQTVNSLYLFPSKTLPRKQPIYIYIYCCHHLVVFIELLLVYNTIRFSHFHNILYVGVCFIGLKLYNTSIFSVNGNVCAFTFCCFHDRHDNIIYENVFSKTLPVRISYTIKLYYFSVKHL